MIIKDPLYGDLQFSFDESRLIKTKSFDRMRRIKQLSFSEYTYPSATHNRYTHSLGVCKIISDMYDSINSKHNDFFKSGDKELLRMMALSHDIGHSPFSHASEVLSDITHEERMLDILKLEKDNVVLNNEYNIEAWDLINQVYNGEGLVYMSDPRLITLHSFMDNFIDADKIDYLIRDAYYCGINYGNFDRHDLIKYLTLIRDTNGIVCIGIEAEGLQALESFILARYYMFSQVYFHPVRRLYDRLFISSMQGVLLNGVYPSEIKKFLQWDDTKVFNKLNFLTDSKFELVYDSDFDMNVKRVVDKKLGDYLLCDTPRKSLFKKDTDDSIIYVEDKLLNRVVPATDLSPILKSIEYANIHKLRYYAPSKTSNQLKEEIHRLLVKEDLL